MNRSVSPAFLLTLAVVATNSTFADSELPEDVQAHEQVIRTNALTTLDENDSRKRLSLFFPNLQAWTEGVQIDSVNTHTGHLTFQQRDLVRSGGMPIVFGRIYDSGERHDNDFGPGWKLSLSESLRQVDDGFVYRDYTNTKYRLKKDGDAFRSENGSVEALEKKDSVVVHVQGQRKVFRRYNNQFLLRRVSSAHGSVQLTYENGRIQRVTNDAGRYVWVERTTDGRISKATDDVGRTVIFLYNDHGALMQIDSTLLGTTRFEQAMPGLLGSVIDSNGNASMEVKYDGDSRVSEIRILGRTTRFQYSENVTTVTDSLDRVGIYTHDERGFVSRIQDFGGDTQEIVWDKRGRPAELAVNGINALTLNYQDKSTQPSHASMSGLDTESISLKYHPTGVIREVTKADGTVIAHYRFNRLGQVVAASDRLGERSYRYRADGLLRQLEFEDSSMEVRTNPLGQITRVRGGDDEVTRFTYNDLDQLDQLTIDNETGSFTINYKFGENGLRSAGNYSIDNSDPRKIEFNYDAVGNLKRLSFPIGEERINYSYEIGSNNEVKRAVRSDGLAYEYGYNQLGQLQHVSSNARSATFHYNGRAEVSAVEIDGKTTSLPASETELLSILDYTTTPANVFGSADDIVYTRRFERTISLMGFSSSSGSFHVLPTHVPPDAAIFSSLRNRGVLSNAFNPIPMELDKPSNPIFIPAEYRSVNCFYCISYIGSATFTMDNTAGHEIAVGEPTDFEFDSSVATCTAMGQIFGIPIPTPNPFAHFVTFGDGDTDISSGLDISESFGKTYSAAGTYTVRDTVTCGCSAIFSFVSATASATVSTPSGVNTQLPSGNGRYSYEPSANQYGTAATIQSVIDLGIRWKNNHPNHPDIGIGDISNQGGGPMQGHTKGHRIGKNVDIRPVRTDGAMLPTNINDPSYDPQRTQDLVNEINADPNVRVIYFNDPNITGVKPLAGHDNHLHVEYKN